MLLYRDALTRSLPMPSCKGGRGSVSQKGACHRKKRGEQEEKSGSLSLLHGAGCGRGRRKGGRGGDTECRGAVLVILTGPAPALTGPPPAAPHPFPPGTQKGIKGRG